MIIFKEDVKEIPLLNVTHYSNFKEYEKYNNFDIDEFKEQLELGNIREITLGTYNGATNKITYKDITDNHIIEAIETEIKESDFYNFFENEFIEKNNIITTNDWIFLYTQMYEVFTFNGAIFVDMD